MEAKVFSIVRNFKEYGYYNAEIKNAAKLLNTHYPSLKDDECLKIIHYFSGLYDEINNIVRTDKERVLFCYQENKIMEWLLDKKILPGKKIDDKLNEEKIIIDICSFLIDWIYIR